MMMSLLFVFFPVFSSDPLTFSKNPSGICAGVQAVRTHSDRMARQGHLSIATQGNKSTVSYAFFPEVVVADPAPESIIFRQSSSLCFV
jgi:hypothetical protein